MNLLLDTHIIVWTVTNSSELAEACQKTDFLLLEGKLDHILMIDTLEYPKDAPRHKDPFDKLLLAQAKSENMFFVTHDEKIPYYNEPCIIPV